MKRRDFITLLSGAAAAPSMLWPLTARAQQGQGMRRVGALLGFAASDPEAQARVATFRQALGELGWMEGRNVRIDMRFAAAVGPDSKQALAAELVSLKPDVILVNGAGDLMAVQRENRNIPIVFATISDPVGLGFVESLGRPGGNITGFTQFEGSSNAKLLEALKEIAPRVAQVALVFDPDNPAAASNMRSLESAAQSLGVKVVAAKIHNAAEIEHAIEAFAREPNGGLIAASDTTVLAQRELIVALAAQHRLPAAYPERSYVSAGGLMSYGVDRAGLYRSVASYVDRILKGAKPADLPVQQPTKFQFALNLKTAKALGIDVPASTLLRADEVIE